MADGDILRKDRVFQAKLIDAAVAATDDGVWLDIADYDDGSIEVTISAAATVQIRCSDAFVKPLNTAHGQQAGADIVASGSFTITQCPRFLKARISAGNTGTVTVTCTLRAEVF